MMWLFDLDNTLHDADAGAFGHIHVAMVDFLQSRLNLSRTEADALRAQYWRDYGATMTGLQKHHAHIDVADFLAVAHPLEAITPTLRAYHDFGWLAQLPGPKAVLSNGPRAYVAHVLNHLGIASCFQAALGTDDLDYLQKPNPEAFRLACHKLGVSAQECVFIDDSIPNLDAARTLGMTTFWFAPHAREYSGPHRHIRHLQSLVDFSKEFSTIPNNR